MGLLLDIAIIIAIGGALTHVALRFAANCQPLDALTDDAEPCHMCRGLGCPRCED